MSTDDATASLIEKLNALDLTDAEREALGSLLAHDDRPDVEGFGGTYRTLKIHGFGITLPDAQEFNLGMPGPNDAKLEPGEKGFNIGMPPTRG